MERYSLLVLTKGEFKDELYEFNARSYDYKEEKDPIYKRLEISYEDARHLDRGEFDLMENDIKALKNFDKALDYPLGMIDFSKYEVSVPDFKGNGLDIGLMQIDDYTTRFSNREQLLDDIRKNGYVNIDSGISNDDLLIFIVKDGSNERIPILNSNHVELIKFISKHDYKDRFSKNKSLKKISNHLLSLFKSRNFYPGASFEMHDFFTTYDGYFSDDLLTFRNWDIVFEKLGMLDAKIFINPLKEYVNIRAYFISQADYKKQEYIYYEKYRNKYAPLDCSERAYIKSLGEQRNISYMIENYPQPKLKYVTDLQVFEAADKINFKNYFDGSLFEEDVKINVKK